MLGKSFALLAILAPAAAHADATDICHPDLLVPFPANKATDVPTNATFFAYYAPSAVYLNEDIVMDGPHGQSLLTAQFDPALGELAATPPGTLDPGGQYTIHWPGLRGRGTADVGMGAVVSFTVGNSPDVAAPLFDGLTSMSWDVERKKSNCDDSIEERYVFDFGLASASDDGGTASLRMMIFQTAGPTVGDAPRPLGVGALPVPGEPPLSFRLPVNEGVGHVCFAVEARDLTGRTAGGASHPQCVKTARPPFFNGCAVALAPSGAAGAVPAAGACACVLISLLLRRRRRS